MVIRVKNRNFYLKSLVLKVVYWLFIVFIFLFPIFFQVFSGSKIGNWLADISVFPFNFKSVFVKNASSIVGFDGEVIGLKEFRKRVEKYLVAGGVIKAGRQFDDEEILGRVNNIRINNKLNLLLMDEDLCKEGENYFLEDDKKGLRVDLEEVDLNKFCVDCKSISYLFSENIYFLDDLIDYWSSNEESLKLIKGDYNYSCSYVGDRSVSLILLNVIERGAGGGIKVTSLSNKGLVGNIINFSEEQLWQALVDYRHAHKKPDLLKSERLCGYGRERVKEHIDLLASTPKENYPKEDKYPLDAHVGFERDGNSGYLFTRTEFLAVAENLAYWPSAQHPIQVIEWGWDTSTEGHKETQLSTEYSHACITGSSGFFVALFGRN